MTAGKPGLHVVTPNGAEGVLLYSDPRNPSRWLVYRDGKGEWHDLSELREADGDGVSDH